MGLKGKKVSENSQTNLSPVDLIKTSKKQWISFTVIFLISWTVSLFLWFQEELDSHILFALNNSNFNDSLVMINQNFSRYGMSIMVLIYTLYLALSLKFTELKKSRQVFLLILTSFAVAGISGDILKEIFNRPRPYQEYANELNFISRSVSPSLPSGHATKSLALALPFLFYGEYEGRFHTLIKYFLVFVALMVCFSRIFLGAHYFSDVLSGIGWAFVCLPVSVMASNMILKKMTYKKMERAAKIWVFVYFVFMIYLIFI
jgi:undecaprenyl-diphosphatase